MILEHDDCRVLTIPKRQLPRYQRVIDYATTALEHAYGLTHSDKLTDEQVKDLKVLKRLREAVQEAS